MLVPEDADGEARRRYGPSTFDLDGFDLWDPFLWSWIPVPFGLVPVVLGLVLDYLPLLLVGAALGALRVGAALLPWDS